MTREEIDKICRRYGIYDYTINDDGSVDVDGNVSLSKKGLTELPLNFNIVTGRFGCSMNKLTTLKGCPKKVGLYFTCKENHLTSLEYGPTKVGGDYNCNMNRLTNLIGSPDSINYAFNCSNNLLTSLEGCPSYVRLDFDCRDNNLTDFKYFPKEIGSGSGFYCDDNPIGSFFDGTGDINLLIAFRTYKVIKGNEVNLKRLKYVMSLFDEPVRLESIKKHYTIV